MSTTREKRFENLRPMSVPDVLDVAFRLYRANFWLLIKIFAILYLPLNALIIVTVWVAPESTAGAPMELDPLQLLRLLLQVVNAMLLWIATGAIIKAVSGAFLGETTDLRSCYEFVMPKAWRLLGVTLLFFIVMAFGFILCLIPGIVFGVWFLLGNVVVVLENLRPVSALERSKRLVTGYFWKVFAAVFLVDLLQWVVMMVFLTPAMFLMGIGAAFSGGGGYETMSGPFTAGVSLYSVIIQMLFHPYLAIVITLLYYDLRIRKEGLDLELMAQEAGYTTPAEG